MTLEKYAQDHPLEVDTWLESPCTRALLESLRVYQSDCAEQIVLQPLLTQEQIAHANEQRGIWGNYNWLFYKFETRFGLIKTEQEMEDVE